MSIDDELRRSARGHRARFDQVPVPVLPMRAPRRMRAAAVAVALLAAAGVTGSVVVLTRRSPHQVRVVSSPSSTTPRPPVAELRDSAIAAAPVLAPAWTPGGEELWSVTSTRDSNGAAFPTQLFGTAAAGGIVSPGLLLEYQRNPPGGSVSGSHTTLVRGVNAAVDAPKDAAGADVEIRWVEANTYVTAVFRGVSSGQAVTVLDALRPRGTDLIDGFDPASAPPGFALLGELKSADASKSSVDAEFEYARSGAAADPSADIQVRTYTRGVYPGYLRTWLGGRRGTDGVIAEPDAYGPYRLLTLIWPDGRAVTVQSTNADAPTLDRIARSVQLLSHAQADSLVNGLNKRLATLPTFRKVSLPTITVELHGDGMRAAICLRRSNTAPFCRANVTLNAPANYIAGSALLGKQWLILVATPDRRPTAKPGINPLPNTPDLAAQTATLAQWHVALFSVPATDDQVQVSVPTGTNRGVNANFTRPRADG